MEDVPKTPTNIMSEDDLAILSDPLTDEFATPELFFGLVGAIGTDLNRLQRILEKTLSLEVGYITKPIKLTEIFSSNQEADCYKRYLVKMNDGTALRNKYKRADAAILKALSGVRAHRRDDNADLTFNDDEDPSELPVDRAAYVFNSLKRPEEVETLRRIYGRSFYLIGAYSSRDTRVAALAERIAESRNRQTSEEFRPLAEALIEKDRADQGVKLGQAVQKTFPEADVFVSLDDEEKAEKEIHRFIRLIFGDAFFTPSRYEQAMFLAKASALRSADLGRQVGAVIIDKEGAVLAVGTNEVPKAKGGQYWEGDNPDKRDFKYKCDSNFKMKKRLIGEISDQLATVLECGLKQMSEKIGNANYSAGDIDTLIKTIIAEAKLDEHIEKSQLSNLIAYFRAVHAEMSALSEAARRGVSIQDAELVCTTFPCHECARRIIAAGISKVVFIEPYPKSLTTELYSDSIVVDNPKAKDSFVHFVPFVGVAPRQFMTLFDASQIERKNNGELLEWSSQTSKPRTSDSPQAYIFKERKRLAFIEASDRQLQTTGSKSND